MQLMPHSAAQRGPVGALEATVSRDAGLLRLTWRLDARIADLELPAPAVPRRVDGLWRHSCFEAFVGTATSATYCELNFAPSGEWAAYCFDDYRAGMRALELATPPRADWRRGSDELLLDVALATDALPLDAGTWRVGLSAVLENSAGTLGYWALCHPSAQPDFHHAGSRVLELPAPVRAQARG